MAGVYKGLTVKIDADTHGLSEALNDIDAKARKVRADLRKSTKALKVDPRNSELVAQHYRHMGEQVALTEAKLKELKAAESQIGRERMSTEAWDTLQREISATEAKLKSAREELGLFAVEQKAAASKMGRAGAAVSAWASAVEPAAAKMRSAGSAMTRGLTVPMVAAGGAATVAAVRIDTALTGVKKTVDATEEEYEALKDAAIEYSKVNAVEAADILAAEELGGQLGVAKENLEAFARVTTGLDIATNMNVEAASTNMARFMNVTKATADGSKTAAQQYEAYGNTIVGLGNKLATTESEISDFSLRMASAGSLAGMSQADILGIGGALSSLGLEAEAGGTAFSNTITMISMAVSQGGKELDGFAKIAGSSSEEFAAKWRTNATGAFIDFINGLAAGKDAGEDMNTVLDELGITGIRQSDAIRRLAGNTELLGNAVQLANDQWRDGTALSDEVANRNQSLAARFEMVRNRVVAVAEDIGGPLADAMLAALDAAEPLFQAIESGARTFSELGEGEQQAVVQALAVIACLGPALSLFGRVSTGAKALGGAMSALSKMISTVSMAMGNVPASACPAVAAMAQMDAKAKLASVGVTALKSAALGLAAVGLVALGAALAERMKQIGDAQKATEGLSDAIAGFEPAAARGASALGSTGRAADDYREKILKATESQARLADDMKTAFQDCDKDAAVLEMYAGKIKELAGNCDGAPDKLAELKDAVDGYNSIAGTSISIIDDQTGKISASTEELDRNTKAWERNAWQQVAQEKLQDLYRQKFDNDEAVAAAKKNLDEKQSAFNLNMSDTVAAADLAQAKEDLADVEEKARSCDDAIAGLTGKMTDNRKAMDLAAQTADDFRKAIEGAGGDAEGFARVADAFGVSADELAARLGDAGISAEQFGSMGCDTFTRLHAQAGMDIPAIAALLGSLNDAKLDPKQLSVNDDGSLAYAGQAIADLDAMDVDDKSFTVNDDGTITFKKGELNGLGLIRIGDKVFKVSDAGTIAPVKGAVEGVVGALDRIPPRKHTEVIAETSAAEASLGRVVNALSRISGNTVATVSSAISGLVQMAAGGLSRTPFKIPRHADGYLAGVATRAMLTNKGLIGEDGAEALIPLTNRRYVRPFAQAVASEMGGASSGGDTNVYIKLDYSAGADAKDITRGIARQLELHGLMRG